MVKSLLNRNVKKAKCVNSSHGEKRIILKEKRRQIKSQMMVASIELRAKLMRDVQLIQRDFERLKRDSSKVRVRNFDFIDGRCRSVSRYFGLSRHNVRKFANWGLLPGVRKASW